MKSILSIATLAFFTSVLPTPAEIINPTGFVSVTSPQGSDITFGPPLHQTPAFSGIIGSISNGDTLTVSSSPAWTADEFAGTHYVLICNGDREGLFASIASNTADSVTLTFISETLGDQLGDRVEAGNTFKIIPFWTFGTLFPDGSVPAGTKVLVSDRSQTGINKPGRFINYFEGFGWYDGPTEKNNEIIYPDESVIIRTAAGQSLDLSVQGAAPTSALRVVLHHVTEGQDQDINFINPFPVPVTLANLFSPGSSGDGDKILLSNNSQDGINKPGRFVNYFDGFGWYDGPTEKNNELIEPGQGITYRRVASNSADLVITQIPDYQQN